MKSPSNGLQLHLYVISEKLGLEEEIGGHQKRTSKFIKVVMHIENTLEKPILSLDIFWFFYNYRTFKRWLLGVIIRSESLGSSKTPQLKMCFYQKRPPSQVWDEGTSELHMAGLYHNVQETLKALKFRPPGHLFENAYDPHTFQYLGVWEVWGGWTLIGTYLANG